MAVLVASAASCTPKGSSRKSPGGRASALGGPDTQVVVAGVLTWKDPRLSSFEPRHRKDQELYDVLVGERQVPRKNARLLLDARASRAAILAALREAAAEATPSTTLVFYYAGHGVHGDGGRVSFASADIDARASSATGLGMDDLQGALGALPRGARVLLLADCCFSGALRQVAIGLGSKGIPAASLTSAEASNSSTQNWTFTQAVIDALRGDSLADRDADGRVVLEELASEVRDAMKFRERQRSGFANHGLDLHMVVSPAARGAVFGAFVPPGLRQGDYLSVKVDGQEEPGRVRSAAPGKVTTRLYRYTDSVDIQPAMASLSPIRFKTYPVGSRLSVTWENRPYEARVTAVDGDFQLITYPGYASYWDEWILSDRILAEIPGGAPAPAEAPGPTAWSKGDRILVEWGGKWWPAVVQERQDNRYFIHYDNYESSWDEWVESSRTRPR